MGGGGLPRLAVVIISGPSPAFWLILKFCCAFAGEAMENVVGLCLWALRVENFVAITNFLTAAMCIFSSRKCIKNVPPPLLSVLQIIFHMIFFQLLFDCLSLKVARTSIPSLVL